MDIKWSWSWRGRLGACWHHSVETECRKVLRAQWLPGCSPGCWEASDQFAHVSEQQLAAQLWACWFRAAFAHEKCCGPMKHEGSVACSSAVVQHIDSGEDWVSCCGVLTGCKPGVDWWLHCGQNEPGSVAGSVCQVRECDPMRSAGDLYSLMVGDQLVPNKLLGPFLCASSSELVALLLVSRRSLSPRVEAKNDADWRRRMWHGCHIYSVNSQVLTQWKLK
jgi:hypothetical protein